MEENGETKTGTMVIFGIGFLFVFLVLSGVIYMFVIRLLVIIDKKKKEDEDDEHHETVFESSVALSMEHPEEPAVPLAPRAPDLPSAPNPTVPPKAPEPLKAPEAPKPPLNSKPSFEPSSCEPHSKTENMMLSSLVLSEIDSVSIPPANSPAPKQSSCSSGATSAPGSAKTSPVPSKETTEPPPTPSAIPKIDPGSATSSVPVEKVTSSEMILTTPPLS